MRLVILFREPPSTVTGSAPEDGVTVLSFLGRASTDAAVQRWTSHGVPATMIRASERIGPATLVARERYLDFMAQWASRPIGGGRSFKERFTDGGRISTWWLSSASMKDNESSGVFDELCHWEVIRQVLGEQRYAACDMVGAEAGLAGVVRAYCVARSTTFRALASRPRPRPPSLAGAVVRHAALAAHVLLHWLFARAGGLGRAGAVPPPPGAAVAFYAAYPTGLRPGPDGMDDAYYGALPRSMSERGLPVLFAASHDVHGLAPLRQWRAGQGLASQRPPAVFLEHGLGGADALVPVQHVASLVRFAMLDRAGSAYRRSFMDGAADVYPLIGVDIRRALLTTEVANNRIVMRLASRFARRYRPAALVSYLELYPRARALYTGIKQGSPGTLTVGYQHASVTSMKLWYAYRPSELAEPGAPGPWIDRMPVPDYLLCQGELGRQLFTASGFPAARCLLTGSPRYAGLARQVGAQVELITKPGVRGPAGSDTKVVLILPSLSKQDAAELIDQAAQALAGRPDTAVVVKPHPLCPVADMVTAARARHGAEMQISTSPLYDCIQSADVVVVSYSTSGDEAIALGKPVVCYAGGRATMSTYLDIPAAPITHDADDLREAMGRMLDDPAYRASYARQRDALVAATFWRLDTGAIDRIQHILTELTSKTTPNS